MSYNPYDEEDEPWYDEQDEPDDLANIIADMRNDQARDDKYDPDMRH